MKCPRCFKNSTIVEVQPGDTNAIAKGLSHYCCVRFEATLSNPKLQTGTENGCGR